MPNPPIKERQKWKHNTNIDLLLQQLTAKSNKELHFSFYCYRFYLFIYLFIYFIYLFIFNP